MAISPIPAASPVPLASVGALPQLPARNAVTGVTGAVGNPIGNRVGSPAGNPAGTPSCSPATSTGRGAAGSAAGRVRRAATSIAQRYRRHRENPNGSHLPEFLLAQLPFVAVIALLGLLILTTGPAAGHRPDFVLGLGLLAVVSVAGAVVPWHRFRGDWLVLVPLLDIAVVAILRDSVTHLFPATGLLTVFPLLWLAYGFSWRAVAAAFASAAFVAVYPFLRSGGWPTTTVEWGVLLWMPVTACALALMARVAANSLRQGQRDLEKVSAKLVVSLASAVDHEAEVQAVLDSVEASIVFYGVDGQVLTNAAANTLEAMSMTSEAMSMSSGSADEASGEAARTAPGEASSPASSPASQRTFRPVFEIDRVTEVPLPEQITARARRGASLDGRVYWVGEQGDQIAVTARSRPVVTKAGAAIGLAVVTYDVTPLVAAVKVRDDFLAAVSQDLKTPLTSIIGYLGILDADELGITAEVDALERNADLLLTLVNNLLDAGGPHPSVYRLPVDVAAVMQGSVDAIRDRAEEAGITLVTGNTSEVVAEIDPVAVGQILGHLLSNAVKFGRAPGAIFVSVASEGDAVVLHVADDGIGISSEDQRQVFERFFRSSDPRAQAMPGVGLGLAIVNFLVEAHHGSISVSSNLHHGTTVTVRLPLKMGVAVPNADGRRLSWLPA